MISWINVSLIWTSSAPGFIGGAREAQTPRMASEIEIDAFNQMFPRPDCVLVIITMMSNDVEMASGGARSKIYHAYIKLGIH